MWIFASVLVAAITTFYLFKRLEPRLDRALALRKEALDIHREEVTKPILHDDVTIPPQMVEWALNESSEWAREDKLRRMRELYAKLHNWDKVGVAIANEEGEASRGTF